MEIFVSGRLCLLGEHSDWAGGWRRSHPEIHVGHCLVAGTRQGIRATAESLSEAVFEMGFAEESGGRGLRVHLDELDEVVHGGGFFSHAAGVAAEVHERFRPEAGLRLRVTDADLPVRKGLSSSAAACVLVARAFNRAHGLGLTVNEEMELAYRGERRAGSDCGRMDQVCALGRRPSFLTFDGDDMRIEALNASAPLHLLLVDLRASKDTRRILADLQACFPDVPGALAAGVREALGPRNTEFAHQGRDLVAAGDARGLGELMRQAQELFDAMVAPVCPELEAPRLHAVLDSPDARELAWGGKGVGSQGDGCAQFVARGPEESRELARRLERSHAVSCLTLELGPAG
jgi:mevalonate kinase